MKKIPTLFKRNYEGDQLVRNEIADGCEWVINGEGAAYRKWDGMAVMYRDGKWYKRYDAKAFTLDRKTGVKKNYNRVPPEGFEPLQEPDPLTGHWPGWVPCDPGNPADKLLYDTYNGYAEKDIFINGTYEHVGPKIGTRGGANPEGVDEHFLIKHDQFNRDDAPRTFDELKTWFEHEPIEGLVWHHPDGRMVKIKKKDFGYKR